MGASSEPPQGERRSTSAQGSDPNTSRGAGNFVGEGFAKGMEALAATPQEQVRQDALKTARAALTSTGSAEEASAWARAIIALLAHQSDNDFFKDVVEALKYPRTVR